MPGIDGLRQRFPFKVLKSENIYGKCRSNGNGRPPINAPLDLDHLRQWVGREQAIDDIVTPGLVNRFNATIGLGSDLACLGDTAPRLIHFCLGLETAPMAGLGPDGHPARGDFLPPVPLPRRMWASSDLSFSGDIRVGDAVRRVSRVAGVEVKQGKGGTLCFISVEHRIEAGGSLAVTERQTLVYRDAPSAAPSAPSATAVAQPAAPRGEAVESVTVTPPLLFRYSALTFNGHRIHYDLPYAVNEEAYPGLVVHGPLQATLLYHYAARRRDGRAPDRFSFRGLAPAFCRGSLELQAGQLNVEAASAALEVWSAEPAGPVAMQAKAEWHD